VFAVGAFVASALVPEDSTTFGYLAALLSLLLLTSLGLGVGVGWTALRGRIRLTNVVAPANPVGKPAPVDTPTSSAKNHSEGAHRPDYVVQRRDWTGDNGIAARSFDVYHPGSSKSLFLRISAQTDQPFRSKLTTRFGSS
ncbi:MAG TPA: hypothetical protein VNZ57_01915, partial [Longimicrobiales bacterium]|nr:hypothetical protein [Longimicrobiales bacterium]